MGRMLRMGIGEQLESRQRERTSTKWQIQGVSEGDSYRVIPL